MAILTDICRVDVRKMLAGSLDPVVATHTIANDSEVIEKGRNPTDAAMTAIALGSSRRVIASSVVCSGVTVRVVARRPAGNAKLPSGFTLS